MACEEVQSWSFGGLTGAFLDLLVAYFLLCISACVFFVSKLLNFCWVYLPCPCNGVFGFRNRDLCLHKLLNEWPVAKICAVQKLVMSRFPFDIRFKDQTSNLSQKLIRDVNGENGVLEFGGESCYSPFSSPRLQSLVDKESGYDAKGKRIVVLKKRTGIRRPRRDSSKSPRIFPLPLDERETREVSGESSIALAARQDEPQATGDDTGERIHGNSKFSGSAVESKGLDISYGEEKFPVVENESDTIRILQGALAKEKAATAALYLELEKERAAAATAADEAMAMIYRLQKDKASTEMEVRQYQRMIEEKFVYDEEEMDVLKEILLTREKENHFLEKEVEAYRQMNSLGSEQSYGDSNDKLCEWRQTAVSSNIDSQLMMPWTNETKSNHMGVVNIADSTSQFEASFVEKQIHSNGHDVVEKSVLSAWEEKLETDNAMCPGMTTESLQANIGINKQFYCDGEERQQNGNTKNNCQSPMLDTETAVYDVHVIEGKDEMLKGESRPSMYAALEGLQDLTCAASGVCSSSEPLLSVGKGKTPL
ncbi:PREDICTED: uncharacterized protein LOC101294522 [Fragaria vesca subsp. vesca]|uniref:uncharacterized protein LOC101294522 n=1 Tax=Fragaria vesca subsp. vesca TaxID=101020 RepID=UPI0002C2DEC1|nr:PREDICTED: uncharacterized protein LOC101294522 [Fragaria vesca subsp. vesca]XP_011458185.1 PREDICTED: uncharacterized protein LOC101294522 [Fragaria vesca subsp. vesca]XP_011458186.1 PREDICTED: uncharacterized protein LOC101294522 [Fragaria vesca subsp. vesca]